MSQNTNIFMSNDDFIENSNSNWANFETFQNSIDQNSKTTTTTIPVIEDDWADFQSNTENPFEEEVQSPSKSDFFPLSNVHSEQINALISTCFPLEISTNTDELTPFQLPNFTTFNDPTKQIPCLRQSLTLWKCLSTISNDPIGIQCQWRKSNIEHLFHQALGVQTPVISENSDDNKINSDNVSVDIDNLSILTNSSTIDDNLFEVNNSCISSSTPQTSRNSTPTLSSQSTPIKTTDLIPGSTAFLTDEPKPVVNLSPRFTFMNPKTLLTRESTIGSN